MLYISESRATYWYGNCLTTKRWNYSGNVLIQTTSEAVCSLVATEVSSKDKNSWIFLTHLSCPGQGGAGFQMSLWWRPGDDTVGLVTRSRKIVTTMQELLGGPEIYVLSSKLVAKEPEVGGPFAWHQVELNWNEIFRLKFYRTTDIFMRTESSSLTVAPSVSHCTNVTSK